MTDTTALTSVVTPATLTAVGGSTFVAAVSLPVVVKPLLVKLGIMDIPNERSSHERPVLRGLGLAVLLAMLIGYGVSILLTGRSATGLVFTVVAGASLASGLLGFGEDLRGVSVLGRSLVLLVIGGAASAILVWQQIAPPPMAHGWGSAFSRTQWPWWLLLIASVYGVLFISSYINVTNFMDGLNGISGFHGLIAGTTFTVVGLLTDLDWLALTGVVLAAGFVGFLPYNLSRPGAFLGDVGSYLLGGAVAVTSFAAFMQGVPLLATIGPMVVYFGDVGVTLVKRVRAGYQWDEPHKEHTYQRVQQLGYSHVQASGCAALATLATSTLGVFSLEQIFLTQVLLFVAGLAVLLVYLTLPRLLPQR